MFKIFCTKSILSSSFEHLNKDLFELEIWDDQANGPICKNQLLARTRDASAVISMLSDELDREFFANAQGLKIVSQYAVGVNNIDLVAAKDYGVIVTNTPDVLTHATAELAFSLLMACARKTVAAHESVKNGKWAGWEPMGFLGKSLRGQSVGIIGAGRIGFEFAKMCQGAFGSPIKYHSRTTKKNFEEILKAQKLDLESLLRTCDIISVHLPLTDTTKLLLDKDMLSLCKKDAILINTARGEVLDQQALIESLKSGHFFAIGLDVTTPEPLPKEDELLSFKNVIITPHIGSATHCARQEMGRLCLENVQEALLQRVPKTEVKP